MATKRQKQQGTTMVRIYRGDAAELHAIKGSAEVVREFGLPSIRPTIALAVAYLVRCHRRMQERSA